MRVRVGVGARHERGRSPHARGRPTAHTARIVERDEPAVRVFAATGDLGTPELLREESVVAGLPLLAGSRSCLVLHARLAARAFYGSGVCSLSAIERRTIRGAAIVGDTHGRATLTRQPHWDETCAASERIAFDRPTRRVRALPIGSGVTRSGSGLAGSRPGRNGAAAEQRRQCGRDRGTHESGGATHRTVSVTRCIFQGIESHGTNGLGALRRFQRKAT